MIKDADKIVQLIYDLLDAVERTTYNEDSVRVRKVLKKYKVIKD